MKATSSNAIDAPKATLMSYIIKGILSQELPWGLVLIGAMIAIMLELTGAPALAFAVGLYLPISTSAPIFVGGLVRYAVDIYLKRKLRASRFDRRTNRC
ncbi:MAG: OPT/YSL family transporter [Pyrinomonadaceae bacterium]